MSTPLSTGVIQLLQDKVSAHLLVKSSLQHRKSPQLGPPCYASLQETPAVNEDGDNDPLILGGGGGEVPGREQ